MEAMVKTRGEIPSWEAAPDGSPVELYARLPTFGEPEMVHAQVAAGASVLDLGCGTGRIALPVAQFGHPVVAVDESAAMLARIPADPRIRPVRASIEDLDLGESFAAVVLAGNLINTDDDTLRQHLLNACARHLAPGGVVLVQWRPPDWFRSGPGTRRLGTIAVSRTETDLGNDRFGFVVDYRDGDDVWHHDYTFRRLSEADLRAVLAEAGLEISQWLSPDRLWFSAEAARGSRCRVRYEPLR
jgi:SAM-dependent methyltransferase